MWWMKTRLQPVWMLIVVRRLDMTCDTLWQANDCVLCRVIHKDSGLVCFVPGTVLVLPCRPDNNFFTVLLYTRQRVRCQFLFITFVWISDSYKTQDKPKKAKIQKPTVVNSEEGINRNLFKKNYIRVHYEYSRTCWAHCYGDNVAGCHSSFAGLKTPPT